MFSYYGSKSKIVDYYPYPKFDKIIEPFAGSARYALKHFEKDVLLVDKYEVIVKIWKYLQQASENDIMSLPEPKYKGDIRDYNITSEEKLLLGFMVAQGVASPQNIVQQFSNIHQEKKRIAGNLYKIKHWVIQQGDYREIPNISATWFVDPPYEYGGEHYRKNNKGFNYIDLGGWCKTRNGQVIVCENSKASWMPFKRFAKLNGAYNTTTEVIWSNYPTVYDNEQQNLF